MEDIKRIIRELLSDILPHSLLTKLYFRYALSRKLDLKNPKSFNEKICWYKLYYCPNNELIIKCADKYLMRDYLKEKGLSKYLVPLIGHWKSADEINWDELPDKFVLKTNHGCHFNIVCKDKSILNEHETKKKLNKWLSIKYGKLNIEEHYNKIEPLVIAEEYIGEMDESVVDYKLHCFNGSPFFIETCSERTINGDAVYDGFNLKWENLNYYDCPKSNIQKPNCLKEIIEIGKQISKDFPYVRIDYYILNDKPLIGELTFVPAGGMSRKLLPEADYELGKEFDIKRLKSLN